MPLQFDFPRNLTVDQFIAQLEQKANAQLISQRLSNKTYYDSFDWRLYSNNIICEFSHEKTSSYLVLRAISTDLLLIEAPLKKMPVFGHEFKPGQIRDTLEPVLEMRALLPVCRLDYQKHLLNILNEDQKIVLRLYVEEYSQLSHRVVLQPLKGYDKAVEHMVEFLTSTLGLTVSKKSVLLMALQVQGRKPKDYSSKLNINLAADIRADIAGKYIYSHLLKAIKSNEQGTIADTDSEFLHDFRVAIRRTRAGLSQIKGILPANISAYYADFFCWLGQITGPTRDLDVYLLNFPRYKNSLPVSIRDDLNPLYDFLLAKQKKAHKELVKKLRSDKYLSTLAQWEQYLKEPSYLQALDQNAKLSIKALADHRIWKVFKRGLQEGAVITALSPPEALHDLRKTCKKLRYLMEFFQSLYPEPQIKHLIKNLKELQEVLGDFQDYAVQEHNLKLFSEEMQALNFPVNTFLAMGVLIQDLDSHRSNARLAFAAKFADLEANRSAFKVLFAPSIASC